MKNDELRLVRIWAMVCLVFAVVLVIATLLGGQAFQMPSYIVFLFIGLLGVLVVNVLSSLNQRLVKAEAAIAELRENQ